MKRARRHEIIALMTHYRYQVSDYLCNFNRQHRYPLTLAQTIEIANKMVELIERAYMDGIHQNPSTIQNMRAIYSAEASAATDDEVSKKDNYKKYI